ncbi:10330_t:CDS:2 [Acaulospora colombiana]|uniref:10330_t:CDS:1 n=1 Tax=Acaulospora colombiana TaxID=27376 RepID=A0ACA9JX80_9GLOM|nr:10330_t:CDS:2 [Acaulospora colombiana]
MEPEESQSTVKTEENAGVYFAIDNESRKVDDYPTAQSSSSQIMSSEMQRPHAEMEIDDNENQGYESGETLHEQQTSSTSLSTKRRRAEKAKQMSKKSLDEIPQARNAMKRTMEKSQTNEVDQVRE